MSGRRRRDDGWDDGRLDAQDGQRDPWADDSIGDWGSQNADPAEEADRSRKPSGGAAGAYVRNAPPSGKAHAAPDFPSFQAGGGSSSGDRYGSTSGYASQRGSANGYASGGYSGDGYRGQDGGYSSGRDGYPGAGYGRNGSNGNGASRRDAAGYDSGYGGSSGYGSVNGRSGSTGYTPEFTPVDNDEPEDDGSAGTPRPYGRLSIYTLHEDKTREFDRLAERAAEGVRTSEPDTLVYVIHVVPKAPQQRIIYEIYRDRAAFMTHERQSHIRQFAADRASCVLATNIIDLRLKYAKVAALGSSPESAVPAAAPGQSQSQSQPSWSARTAEPAQSARGGYAAATQYSPAQYSAGSQYSSAQYSSPQSQGTAAVASFTPAADRYGADNSQYPTVGREAYSPAPQYGNSGNGAYGTSGSQYGAANSNGYSGAAGYSNGGSYPSNGYPSSNGYQSANGYSGDNGYSGANGYQGTNGYSGSNGYSNGNGYQSSNGYANGANGYGNGYSNGAANGNSSGYGTSAGYTESSSGSYSASASTQYAPRYRELTSGASPDSGSAGQQGGGSRYQDENRHSEWDPRSQGYR